MEVETCHKGPTITGVMVVIKHRVIKHRVTAEKLNIGVIN